MADSKTALVIDFNTTEESGNTLARQLLLTHQANGTDFFVVTRTYSEESPRKHWTVHNTAASGIGNIEPDDGNWFYDWLSKHTAHKFGISAVFAIVITDDEIDKLSAENASPPPSLMTRLQRARKTHGDEMLQEPHIQPDMVIETLRTNVKEWRAGYYEPCGGQSGTQKGAASEAAEPPAVLLAADADRISPNTHVTLHDGTVYVARQFGMEGLSDIDSLRASRKQDVPVLLYGPPGTGKTRAFEAAFGEELFTVLGTVDTEVADFVGGYVPNPDGTFRWINGPLVDAMQQGKPLLVDEIGLVDPKTLSVLYSAMDGRKRLRVTANPLMGEVEAKPGFVVVAATNPNAPGVRLSEALLSRFIVQAEYHTSIAVMKSLGVPQPLLSAFANLSIKAKDTGLWCPQARELLAFKKVQELFGRDVALRNLVAIAPEGDREEIAKVLGTSFAIKALTGLAADG